jgi:hypothetical protein
LVVSLSGKGERNGARTHAEASHPTFPPFLNRIAVGADFVWAKKKPTSENAKELHPDEQEGLRNGPPPQHAAPAVGWVEAPARAGWRLRPGPSSPNVFA